MRAFAFAPAVRIVLGVVVCLSVVGCSTHESGPQCNDDVDNDGDGAVDCADSDCFLDAACLPCGDGHVDDNEACDDGNTKDGDGCSAFCLLERCGNGELDAGEECDDGNVVAGDGCDFRCKVSFCGNGFFDPDEECDDGNAQSGDGCSSTCKVEVSSRCGDFVFDPGEQCDDGNTRDGDGCSHTCHAEFCGDGVRQPRLGEQCDVDDGTPEGARCLGCQIVHCGNGVLEAQFGEQCDDGNDNFGDGCSNCIIDHCGDFFLSANEQCDDGNLIPGDGCGPDCRNEFCGDGVVQPRIGELCDDDSANCVGCQPVELCDGDAGLDAVCFAVHGEHPSLVPTTLVTTHPDGQQPIVWLGTPNTQMWRYDVGVGGTLDNGNFVQQNFEAFAVLRAGDIDGDGFDDVAGGATDGTAGIVLPNGTYQQLLFPFDRVLDVAVGNAGGSGQNDLVAVSRNAVLSVELEDSFAVQISLDHIATRVVTVPLFDETVAGGPTISAGIVAASGVHLQSAHVEAAPSNALVKDATVDLDISFVADLARADVDGDGIDDLVVLTQAPDQIVALMLDGQSGLPPASEVVVLSDAPGGEALAAGDIDGDGDVDFVVTSDAGISLHRAKNGYAASPRFFPVPDSPTRVDLRDLDDDGDVDMVYAGGFFGGFFAADTLLLLRE